MDTCYCVRAKVSSGTPRLILLLSKKNYIFEGQNMFHGGYRHHNRTIRPSLPLVWGIDRIQKVVLFRLL